MKKKKKEEKVTITVKKKKGFIYIEARTKSWKSHVTIQPV